jgi:diguanylate cyclase (GGDEF)-like protein/PAS domain S-box-containing protein
MWGEIAKISRKVLARDLMLIRRMGVSDIVFLMATLLGLGLFTWYAISGTPGKTPVTFALCGAFLAFAAWYLLVGLRRKQLLGYFREAIEKAPAAFAIYDESDRLVARNSAYEAVHSTAFATVRGSITYEKLARADCAGGLPDAVEDTAFAERLRAHREASGQADDRSYSNGRWLRVLVARTLNGARVSIGMDVTELREAKAAADREYARFHSLAQTLPIGIWQFDADGRTIFVNRGLLDLFGQNSQADIEGVAAPDFIAAHVEGFDANQLNADYNNLGNLTVRGVDGSIRHVIVRTSGLSGEATGAGETIMSFIDVTALKEAERRIDYLAHRDTLTGVRNRAAFQDAIETATDIATGEHPCWVLAMDLDGFKPVNDQYGHAAGDQLMREFADRVRKIGRPDSFLYRLGGDEFCIIQMDTPRAQVDEIAKALVAAAAQPFQIGHNRIGIGVSIGIAAIPLDAADSETAQRYADLALYSVKKHGGGDYAFFTSAHAERDLQERVMTLDLSRALASEEFEFVYQPVFRRSDRAIVGIEVLLRWINGRTGNNVPPAEFVTAAERSGIICRMDYWVISRAARQISQWLDRGIEPPLVMINMSPLTLEDSKFLIRIDEVLENHPGARGRICIEITEDDVTDNAASFREIFQQLRDRGIQTAIDDFGTGQTSVTLLRDFPVSFIKLDKSYTEVTQTDRQAMSIVTTIVRLSRELGVNAIGEGVETQEHLAALETIGCDMFQGHLWGRPVAAGEIEERFSPRQDLTITIDRAVTRRA